MSELNLCEILKGYEGETFYSPIYGDVTIDFFEGYIRMWPKSKTAYLPIASNGHHNDNPSKGEMLLFPSKDQRDWNKWDKENNKTPKTWSELLNKEKAINYNLNCINEHGLDYYTSIG